MRVVSLQRLYDDRNVASAWLEIEAAGICIGLVDGTGRRRGYKGHHYLAHTFIGTGPDRFHPDTKYTR